MDEAERADLGSSNFASAPCGACPSHDENDDDFMGEGDDGNDWVQESSLQRSEVASNLGESDKHAEGHGGNNSKGEPRFDGADSEVGTSAATMEDVHIVHDGTENLEAAKQTGSARVETAE